MFTLSKKSARTLGRRLPAQFAAAIAEAAGKEHKYRAETDRYKLTLDGLRFDSVRELNRYAELKMLKRAGKIGSLLVHPRYPVKICGKHICDVELDFKWVDKRGNIVYEDVKGVDNPVSRLKRKLLESVYGIKVMVIK